MTPIAQDRFALVLGAQQLESSFEQAIFRMDITPEHTNILGGVHGGVIFSLADFAFASACNAGEGSFIGLQAEIRYMAAAKDKQLIATAKRVGGTRKFAHYEVMVTDGLGNALALFTSTAYRVARARLRVMRHRCTLYIF